MSDAVSPRAAVEWAVELLRFIVSHPTAAPITRQTLAYFLGAVMLDCSLPAEDMDQLHVVIDDPDVVTDAAADTWITELARKLGVADAASSRACHAHAHAHAAMTRQVQDFLVLVSPACLEPEVNDVVRAAALLDEFGARVQ